MEERSFKGPSKRCNSLTWVLIPGCSIRWQEKILWAYGKNLRKHTFFKYFTSLQVLHKTGFVECKKAGKVVRTIKHGFCLQDAEQASEERLHISTVQIFESDVDLFFKLNFRLQCQELGLQTEQLIEFINKVVL